MRKILHLILFGFALTALSGCSKDDPLVKEKAAIDKYLADHGFTVQPTSTGLYYIETLKGTGPDADIGDQAKVRYKGYFTDGTVFDSGIFSFQIGARQVILGWDEGISYMKEGGKAILVIPSSLGYGPYGSGSIPGYTPLVFEVELIDLY